MKAFVAIANTESGDQYTWVFDHAPTRDRIIKIIWEWEGKNSPLKWYRDTTSVKIEEHDVITGV